MCLSHWKPVSVHNISRLFCLLRVCVCARSSRGVNLGRRHFPGLARRVEPPAEAPHGRVGGHLERTGSGRGEWKVKLPILLLDPLHSGIAEFLLPIRVLSLLYSIWRNWHFYHLLLLLLQYILTQNSSSQGNQKSFSSLRNIELLLLITVVTLPYHILLYPQVRTAGFTNIN